MSSREVRIDSYFSLPTDLAAEMKGWAEFIAGAEYSVRLGNSAEQVEIGLTIDPETSPAGKYVFVRGTGGALFQRALGATVVAMAQHSDYVWVMNWSGHDA